MARKERKAMPELIFVGDPKKRIKFKYVAMLIIDTHEDGVPRNLTLLRENDVVSKNAHFMTGYIPEFMAYPPEQPDEQPET